MLQYIQKQNRSSLLAAEKSFFSERACEDGSREISPRNAPHFIHNLRQSISQRGEADETHISWC